jgi:lipoprotein NlpI
MIRYIYDDDDDEEELWRFYDDDPDDPYPEFIISINEEKMMEIYEKVKAGKRRKL